MNKIRTIIIDDEIDACEGLQLLLSDQKDMQVVSVCRNGREAVAAINRLKPELIFLDIQMPGLNGFEVLENIDSAFLPAVIFVTAYDEYALNAFEVHALDYLQKPFTDDRFLLALDYARERIRTGTDDSIKSLLEPSSFKPTPEGKLKLKASGKIHFIDYEDLSRIEGFDYYIKVHAGGNVYLVRESIKNIIQRLPQQFVRIHKSNVINLDQLVSLEPLSRGNYQVTLSTGDEVMMSKTYRDQLKDLL
ncbi:MAG: response regulator transcription factor [Roseivirga sp.]|nr:response regulator transcription factor [Roseivirga sp.]